MLEGTHKGERTRIIALAHQTEVMARQKKLKELPHYLKPAKSPSAEADGAAVLAMMRRAQARQKKG